MYTLTSFIPLLKALKSINLFVQYLLIFAYLSSSFPLFLASSSEPWQSWFKLKLDYWLEIGIILFMGFVNKHIFNPVGTSKKWNEYWGVEKDLKIYLGSSHETFSLNPFKAHNIPNTSFYFSLISFEAVSQSMSPSSWPSIFDLLRSWWYKHIPDLLKRRSSCTFDFL